MSSSASSSYDGDSRQSDGLLHSSEETQPVDQVDAVQEASQRDLSRSRSPSPPHTSIPGPHTRLLPDGDDLGEGSSSSSASRPLSPGFVSSPLNPNNLAPPRSRKPTKTSTLGTIQRVASEEALTLSADSRRGSMILYRLADNAALPAPRPLREHRDSLASSSRESILSISYDSKYPSGAATPHRGFIPYVYNPEIDKRAPEPDDYLYDAGFGDDGPWYQAVGWRGIVNISMLVIVVVSLLALFICYPVVSSQHYDTLKVIAKDSHINSTGQYVPFSQAHADEQRYALPFVKDPEFQS
ncbi:hypothetical protein FOMPIDRAFT_153979 [Fomitopsis schrenkii]|uniref:Uncharacterized protein n=1 Tax=Fomitopsis schrenkii TaxID=2126942 RepID=S8EIU5_FOMSC|nr:hypothetical protein FOMPIDRAFT_153979 [Fomitopsis schrenkii]